MKQKIILILLFTVLSFGVKASNDSTVYWKRYVSIDLVSFGKTLNDYSFSQTKLYSYSLFSFHFGILRKKYTPFINVGVDATDNLMFFGTREEYTDFSIRLGGFFYKSKLIEGTFAAGIGFLKVGSGENIKSFSTNLRLIYKPLKWLGVGVSYYSNINEFQYLHGLRVCLNFSNGL